MFVVAQKDERLEEDRLDEHGMQDGEMMLKAVRSSAEGNSLGGFRKLCSPRPKVQEIYAESFSGSAGIRSPLDGI